MLPHGIMPFARGQHQINVLYEKLSSTHQRAPPVKCLKPPGRAKLDQTSPKSLKTCYLPMFVIVPHLITLSE